MARIKISDLPEDAKISKDELKKISGGGDIVSGKWSDGTEIKGGIVSGEWSDGTKIKSEETITSGFWSDGTPIK